MNRFPSDDAGNWPGFGMHKHSLAEQNLHVPTTDRVDSQKTKAVNVSDDESDLVAVGVEQNCRAAAGVDCR
jgi:hypothetical protein